MEVLEDQLSMPQSVGDGEQLGEQLNRLRHKRLHRPRILFNHSVSSRTGKGLDELRHALTALMENQRLFRTLGLRYRSTTRCSSALHKRVEHKRVGALPWRCWSGWRQCSRRRPAR